MKTIKELIGAYGDVPVLDSKACKNLAERFIEKPDYPLINRAVGIEIEVEGIPNHVELKLHPLTVLLDRYWSFAKDNSLRNNGLEFVSKPVKGVGLINALWSVNKILEDCKENSPVFSSRCSVHLHFNCLDLTIEELFKVLLAYVYVEPVIYELPAAMGMKNRKKNIFCVPFNSGSAVFQMVQAFFRYSTVDKEKMSHDHLQKMFPFGEHVRYFGLNLHALYKFGSIEFRHFPGTYNIDQIMVYINAINRMFNYAKNHTMEEMFETFSALNTSSQYSNVITEVLGYVPVNIERLIDDLENGVKIVKRLRNCYDYEEVDFDLNSDYWKKAQEYSGIFLSEIPPKKPLDLAEKQHLLILDEVYVKLINDMYNLIGEKGNKMMLVDDINKFMVELKTCPKEFIKSLKLAQRIPLLESRIHLNLEFYNWDSIRMEFTPEF